MRFLAILLMVLVAGCATRVELQGHRGARGLLPENTLPAFAKALEIGVDVLELDTGITKDGVVVIAHDAYLNADFTRDKSGKWLESGVDKRVLLKSLTFEEVQQYDVGRIDPASAYAKRFPQQVPVDGTRIPRLMDLFDLVKRTGNTRVRFNIETKIAPHERQATVPPEEFVDRLLAVIGEAGMAERVTIQSFDWRTLKIVQQKAPQTPTVYLSAQQKFLDNILADSHEGSPWTAGINASEMMMNLLRAQGIPSLKLLEAKAQALMQTMLQRDVVPAMIQKAGGKIWSPYHGDLTVDKVQAAKRLGIKVIAWTVNEPKDIDRMLDFYKVDGIISDYPDRVRAAMAKRGMELPTR